MSCRPGGRGAQASYLRQLWPQDPARVQLLPQCGEALGGGEEPGEAFDPGERVACSDGSCIGIIGPDGKCTECGKPYTGPAE